MGVSEITRGKLNIVIGNFELEYFHLKLHNQIKFGTLPDNIVLQTTS